MRIGFHYTYWSEVSPRTKPVDNLGGKLLNSLRSSRILLLRVTRGNSFLFVAVDMNIDVEHAAQ